MKKTFIILLSFLLFFSTIVVSQQQSQKILWIAGPSEVDISDPENTKSTYENDLLVFFNCGTITQFRQIQTNYYSYVWDSYIPIPDLWYLKFRISELSSIDISDFDLSWFCIPTQDSSFWASGPSFEIKKTKEWQEIAIPKERPSFKNPVKNVGTLYFQFSAIFKEEVKIPQYISIIIEVAQFSAMYNDGRPSYDYYKSKLDPTAVVEKTEEIPKNFSLSQNYPNPFNPTTKIRFTVPISGQVNLKIFNLLGQEVRTLIQEEKSSGNYEVEFNASNLPSGTYFYRLQVGSFVETKNMILLK